MIPYGRQDIQQGDINAVVEVLQSDFLTQGPAVPKFEQAIADYCGVKHALAVNSATSALHIACLALGLGKGDILWTTPITFVASANCALYCGADVSFVDIDPKTYNMSIDALRIKLEQANAAGKLPKVVIPVHLCGQSCDMRAIHQLAKQYGFRIIEDASHAIGGRYYGKPVGCCEYSDITIFSFHPVKIITTAEGGMALTNRAELAQKMDLLRSHGITRDPDLMTKPSEGGWYYQQIDLGFNYRMTDLQAALGYSQLQRLDEYVAKRQEIVGYYNEQLKELPLQLPHVADDIYSAFHLYSIRIAEEIKGGRKALYNHLRKQAIGVNVHYIPVHTQPYYQDHLSCRIGDYPEAEKYYEEALTLPIFPTLNLDQQKKIVDKLIEFLS